MTKKIFDLFLFLLFFWMLLMLNFQHFNHEMLIAGTVSSILVAFLVAYLGLVNSESRQNFLSLRFYSHFLRIYGENFHRSFLLIFDLALGLKPFAPATCKFAIRNQLQFDPALLSASINMISGLMIVEAKDDHLLISAINPDCFADFNQLQIFAGLSQINDDDLV